MAAAIRSSCRMAAARSKPVTSCLQASAARNISLLPRQALPARRTYASKPFASFSSASARPSSSKTALGLGLGLGLVAVGGSSFWFLIHRSNDAAFDKPKPSDTTSDDPKLREKTSGKPKPSDPKDSTLFTPAFADYKAVYNALAERLEEHDEYEDGSFGPVVLRLAWHCSGTYDAATQTGGSNGATMRFDPESEHGANNGLKIARDFLEPVKEQFPWITYSDLWTLAGVCAIQEMQGPIIPWRPGRADRDASWCTPDGRLPDGAKGENHLRSIFGRMGFNDQEIVALSGAHALGRCHTDRSGFQGPWTFSPTVLTNDFFRLLLDETWHWKKWNGPKQYEDNGSNSLMMLPTDMALVKDSKFLPHVKKYAEDNDAFFRDFSNVVCKLFELGVPFQSSDESRFTFHPKVFE